MKARRKMLKWDVKTETEEEREREREKERERVIERHTEKALAYKRSTSPVAH